MHIKGMCKHTNKHKLLLRQPDERLIDWPPRGIDMLHSLADT